MTYIMPEPSSLGSMELISPTGIILDSKRFSEHAPSFVSDPVVKTNPHSLEIQINAVDLDKDPILVSILACNDDPEREELCLGTEVFENKITKNPFKISKPEAAQRLRIILNDGMRTQEYKHLL